MAEEMNHCDVAAEPSINGLQVEESLPVQQTQDIGDETLGVQRPRGLFIVDEDTDTNADVESNADSDKDDSVSAAHVFHDVNGEDSKTKLLGSPLTALTFPPPPPVEDEEEEFQEEESGVESESPFQGISDAELAKTVNKIVSAAINEAVLVETIVSMAMKDAVASIMSLLQELKQQEEKTEDQVQTVPTSDQADKIPESAKQEDQKESKDNIDEKDEKPEEELKTSSSHPSTPVKETPVEKQALVKDQTDPDQTKQPEKQTEKTQEESLKNSNEQNINKDEQTPPNELSNKGESRENESEKPVEQNAHESEQSPANEQSNLADNSGPNVDPSEALPCETNSISETQESSIMHPPEDNVPAPNKDHEVSHPKEDTTKALNTEEVEVEINHRQTKAENAAASNANDVIQSANTPEAMKTSSSNEQTASSQIAIDASSEQSKLETDQKEPQIQDQAPTTNQTKTETNTAGAQKEDNNKDNVAAPKAAAEEAKQPITQTPVSNNPNQIEQVSSTIEPSSGESVKKSGCCSIL